MLISGDLPADGTVRTGAQAAIRESPVARTQNFVAGLIQSSSSISP
jgi:hypothetical protein